jgi:hypothetical protein
MGAIAEYSLRKIPNDYAFKNQWLTQNSKEVEVLALGASSVLFDINPYYLNKNTFNAGHVSQSLKYDHMIFDKFTDNMTSLEYVIMSIDYWSIFRELEDSGEWWRVKYYNIYYGSNFHKWEPKYNLEIYFHDINTIKRAARGFLTLMGIKNETHRTVNDQGYSVHYTLENRPKEWDKGAYQASLHNDLITGADLDDVIKQNKQFVKEIIEKCAEKNVKVILLNLPLYKSYRENLKNEFKYQQKSFCEYFAQNFPNTSYYDFSDNPIFTEDDFYDFNHLNEIGSKKFTLMLDSIINNQ